MCVNLISKNWISAITPYIPQTIILVKWSSYQRYVVVFILSFDKCALLQLIIEHLLIFNINILDTC